MMAKGISILCLHLIFSREINPSRVFGGTGGARDVQSCGYKTAHIKSVAHRASSLEAPTTSPLTAPNLRFAT